MFDGNFSPAFVPPSPLLSRVYSFIQYSSYFYDSLTDGFYAAKRENENASKTL